MVPFSPYLSKLLQCHLNVEYCGTIRAVKYLYTYTYKGHGRATLEFHKCKVKQFLDARYVGPPEAAWRLFACPMHDKSHNVERLAVHLKDGETSTFQSGQDREAVVVDAKTTLIAWFDLNAEDPDGH